ncbi:hypothetical protein BV898_06059 [Hypsibius exemplaris]|uniref:DDE Tnp4 domain-containing protein n=1 Tax=Hypsibius exemplaris TaxID=2072580 RepID=A0A1W0WX90_HYPEX|nr:hypothetical protein BV898_06059 [Hypsibius exemplaris]
MYDHMLSLVYSEHHHLLIGIRNGTVDQEDLRSFAEAIRAKGAPLPNCVGFIDGTMLGTCRPIKHQKVAYSGHKRHHGIRFQAVMYPNGMIGHLYGPIEGRRHDAGILRESGLLDVLGDLFIDADGRGMGFRQHPVKVRDFGL